MKFLRSLRPFLLVFMGMIFLTEYTHSQNQQTGVHQIAWDHPIPVVSYSLGRTASIDFRGTMQSPGAKGSARVKMELGTVQIDAKFENLQQPPNFGPEYTAYVLWAVTSDGQTANLGEITINNQKGQIKTSAQYPAFAMFVTAEPYFAIGVPSNVVIMENAAARGRIDNISNATPQMQLVEQGAYAAAGLDPFIGDGRTPRDLFQARNALRVADWQGAGRYATEMYQEAEQLLRQAELAQQQRGNNQIRVIQSSRQAVQMAESARVTAVQKIEEENLAREREAAEAARLAAAQEAEKQTQLRAEAEAASLAAAEEAQRQVRLRAAAESSRLDAEAARLAAAQEAERASLAADEARELLAQAQAAMRKLEAEQQELRSRLLTQLNKILETRDTARGLILNMGDVLFDVGKSELRPEAREKLARLSGLLLAYPTLQMEIEGHTDSTGSDELNQRLSEERAASVETYLLSQGVAEDLVAARGFGETRPIAPNDVASGRQRNRRVEIVVSGEILGNPLSGN